MDSLGGNLSHAPVMKNAPNTLSTVRCMFTTRPLGEIHNFSNSGEALGIHCDVYEHMVSPGASQPCLHWQAGDTVRGGKGTKKWLLLCREGKPGRSSPCCWLGYPWRTARDMPGGLTSWSLWPCYLLQDPAGDCERFLLAVADPRVLWEWCFSVQSTTSIFPPMAAALSAAWGWGCTLWARSRCLLVLMQATAFPWRALQPLLSPVLCHQQSHAQSNPSWSDKISSRKRKKPRSFGWSIPESAICTHFFSCFDPLRMIQEQAKEIPETS